MRIFVASGIFHPESGGPATYLLKLLPALQEAGHDLTVLTFGEGEVESYPYPLTRIPRAAYPLRQGRYFQAAGRLWSGHDLAFVHSLGLSLPAKVRPRLGKIVGDKAWERSVNRGWISPRDDIDAFQTRRDPDPRVALAKRLRNRQARAFDHVIVPSNYLKLMVGGWGLAPEQISVIYNAIEPPSGPQIDQAGACARLVAWKGIDHLINAITPLRAVHLLVAGDGESRPMLEALAERLGIRDRVHFLGRVPRDKMPLYFKAADYTALYSGYEGLSHVLLESLQAGTPVIASDKGGNPELITHDANGLLVPYVDVTALRGVIEEAFSPGKRAALAGGTGTGLERFSWDRLVTDTLKVLNHFS